MRKLKKEIMLIIEITICQMKIETEKKRQNLSNRLINCVKELEILVSINKFLNISE